MIRLIATLLAVLALTHTGAIAQDFDAVEIKTHPVAEGLAMLTGAGGNIAIHHGPDGVLMIDDQYAPLSDKITAAIAKLSDQPVRFLINTHWHGDHTGGNEPFGQAGALIVAHDNVRIRMEKGQDMPALGRTVPPAPPVALPVVTFADGLSFHINGVRVDVHHVKHAHTDGDSIVHIPGLNVIHTGDVYFNGFYPFIDGGSDGSLEGMIAAVERTLALADDETRIIPGHGALSNKQELMTYRDMLAGVRTAVGVAKEEGLSADQAVEADILSAFNEKWGGGFMSPERFLRIIYTDH